MGGFFVCLFLLCSNLGYSVPVLWGWSVLRCVDLLWWFHSGGFCFGLLPLLLCFRGGAVRFSYSLGAFGFVLFLVVCWGIALLEINS